MRTILAILLLVSVAHAQQVDVMGKGAATCAQFAQYNRTYGAPKALGFFDWAQGYMSGLNSAAPTNVKKLTALPIQGQLDYVQSYCDKYPLKGYAEAVISLYLSLPNL